jgi:hypothetical protein
MPMQKQLRGVSMASLGVKPGRSGKACAIIAFAMAISTALWAAGVMSPDRLLERSYARSAPLGTIHLDEVVSDGDRVLPVTKVANRVVPRPALLVDGVAVQTGVLSAPLAIGARVRLAPGAAETRELEVVDAAEMDMPVVGLPGVRLQLVTARLVDAPEHDTLQLVFAVRDGGDAKVVPASGSRTPGKVL